MTRPPYKKPPIVEAAIALHFATPLDDREIDAFARRRRTTFPLSEELVELSAAFNPQTKQSISGARKTGRKLTSSDGDRVIIIMQAQLAVIQLAPYKDWNDLFLDAREQWNALFKIIKRRRLSHASTRYQNRIDIPIDESGRVDLHKYFTVGLSLPPYVQAMSLQTFYVHSTLLDATGRYRHTLQLASTPSPLIDHVSFTIDTDIATTEPMPDYEDKMWALVNSLRKSKNDLFESCITPATRKLFK
jgi:uncharacterized protein (TIGR04255 family)